MKLFAFIVLSLLSSCKDEDKFYGYLEGKFVYPSCEFPGKLKTLAAQRGSTIKEGDLLFEIDDQNEVINIDILNKRIEIAKSNYEASKKDYTFATQNLERKQKLNRTKVISDADLDQAQNQYFDMENKLKTSELTLHETESNLDLEKSRQSRKSIYAKQNGFISDTFYSLGEFVSASTPVMSILPENEVRAIFFVPQHTFQAFKKGDLINVFCEVCPANLKAEVSYLASSPEFTPPNIYSSNFREELVFRIEANVSLKDAKSLNVGQPIYVKLAK